MKINVNKKLVATLLAGSMAFTLVGCGSKNSNEYELPSVQKDVEIHYAGEDLELEEVSNEISNEQASEDYNINLVVTNLPENTRISLHDGLYQELYEFTNNNNSYQIPSKDFTISFDMNGNTYSYDITGKNNETIFVSSGLTKDNNVQFNVEKNTILSFEELQSKLAENNINLAHLYNNDDLTQIIVERQNKTYTGNDLTSERTALYVNDVLLNESNKNNDKTSYNSPLRVGDGVNNIEIIDNETVKLSYEKTYKDDYKFIENIENNVNYFFNKINNTNDNNYYKQGDLDLASLVNENTNVNERIEKFYHGEASCIRYYYNYDGNNILEFGQVNYDNEYFLNDPNNLVNMKSKTLNKNSSDYTNTSSYNNTDSDYVHYYPDDYKVHGSNDDSYVHYYSDDNQVYGNDDGPYVHYYSDDNQVYGNDNEPYVHYYSDDDFSIYNNDYNNNEIYEYEEEHHLKF